jgi:hypothetical protein
MSVLVGNIVVRAPPARINNDVNFRDRILGFESTDVEKCQRGLQPDSASRSLLIYRGDLRPSPWHRHTNLPNHPQAELRYVLPRWDCAALKLLLSQVSYFCNDSMAWKEG